MQMPDVNVLVYAHREESPEHVRHAARVTALATGPEPFALSELVLQGFIRVVTNPRIFNPPSTTQQAFEFVDSLTELPGCVIIRPGPTTGKSFGVFARWGTYGARLWRMRRTRHWRSKAAASG